MGKNKRRFKERKKHPQRNYRKIFVIATEGDRTEPEYFERLAQSSKVFSLHLVKSKKASAPLHVLKKAKVYKRENGLSKDDEVWLVIDRNQWTTGDLDKTSQECNENGFFLAVSNPCFEYWLLLHFVEIDRLSSINNCSSCKDRLKKYLPNYDDRLEFEKIRPGVEKAISRAERQDQPPCKDWPRSKCTTVYRLVRKLKTAERGDLQDQ